MADNKETIKIVEKAHCPHCGEDLCTENGIYFFLKSPDGSHAMTHLPKTLGDYTVPLHKYDSISEGTELDVKCGRCQTPVNQDNYCLLKRVKLVGDPCETYMLKFLSEMGKHGTLLLDEHGNVIHHWGEHSPLLIQTS